MNLEYFLQKNQVVKLKSKEKPLIFKELVDKLQDLGLIENKERYYAQIVHRESLENTGIGSGLAIPHARTESVSQFVSIFGVLDDPVDYQSYDGVPVRYVLLSIFPSSMSTRYLYLIGMIARIFSNPEKRKLFDEETTTTKIYSLLKKEGQAYFESISVKDEKKTGKTANLSGVPSSDLDLLIRLDRLYQLFDEGDHSDAITKKIDELKKLIDYRSLTYYDRMRKKRNNPFSIVEKTSCSGCHMEIPPIYLKQIRDREGIPLCTHCGRFLIIV